MKKTYLAMAMASVIMLSACSSTKIADVGSGTSVPAGTQQAISEQRAVNDFKRQGVKVIFSTFGAFEAVEATGYAPV
jgi:major membrane immunogen (membrane-anchored lipoprotein)